MSKRRRMALVSVIAACVCAGAFAIIAWRQAVLRDAEERALQRMEYEERRDEELDETVKEFEVTLRDMFPTEFVRARVKSYEYRQIGIMLDISAREGFGSMLEGSKQYETEQLVHDVYLACYGTNVHWTELEIVVKPMGNVSLTFGDQGHEKGTHFGDVLYPKIRLKWHNYWDEDMV